MDYLENSIGATTPKNSTKPSSKDILKGSYSLKCSAICHVMILYVKEAKATVSPVPIKSPVQYNSSFHEVLRAECNMYFSNECGIRTCEEQDSFVAS